jgi:hypothetical protein
VKAVNEIEDEGDEDNDDHGYQRVAIHAFKESPAL